MSPFFKRSKKTTIAELEDYYSKQNSSTNTIRAWLMAFLSLFITVFVVVVLFFTVRLGWRTLFGQDTDPTSIAQTSGARVLEDGTIVDGVVTNPSSNDTAPVTTTTPADDGDQSDSTSGGVVSDSAATITRGESNDTSEVAGTSTPSTAETTSATNSGSTAVANSSDTSAAIPNTGSGELLALAPLLAVAFGYSYSRRRFLSK